MFVTEVRHSDTIYSYNSIRLNVLRKEMVEADRAAAGFDVQKAISDMAKDMSLQQYQYFVSSSTC